MDQIIYNEKIKWNNIDYNNSFDKLYYNIYNVSFKNSENSEKKTSKEGQEKKKEKNKDT